MKRVVLSPNVYTAMRFIYQYEETNEVYAFLQVGKSALPNEMIVLGLYVPEQKISEVTAEPTDEAYAAFVDGCEDPDEWTVADFHTHPNMDNHPSSVDIADATKFCGGSFLNAFVKVIHGKNGIGATIVATNEKGVVTRQTLPVEVDWSLIFKDDQLDLYGLAEQIDTNCSYDMGMLMPKKSGGSTIYNPSADYYDSWAAYYNSCSGAGQSGDDNMDPWEAKEWWDYYSAEGIDLYSVFADFHDQNEWTAFLEERAAAGQDNFTSEDYEFGRLNFTPANMAQASDGISQDLLICYSEYLLENYVEDYYGSVTIEDIK
jgi:proteasome lid subunit RPN8/RPN11